MPPHKNAVLFYLRKATLVDTGFLGYFLSCKENDGTYTFRLSHSEIDSFFNEGVLLPETEYSLVVANHINQKIGDAKREHCLMAKKVIDGTISVEELLDTLNA